MGVYFDEKDETHASFRCDGCGAPGISARVYPARDPEAVGRLLIAVGWLGDGERVACGRRCLGDIRALNEAEKVAVEEAAAAEAAKTVTPVVAKIEPGAAPVPEPPDTKPAKSRGKRPKSP